ncbi:MAG: hypothetical protein R3B70_04100 [Polyangiaceae bacterium]
MAGRYDVSTQRESLHERFEQADDSPDQRPAFRALLREAMRMRPAEHYFPLLGATAAFRWKDEKPMPWLQLTLERAPVNGRAHALLAQVLASKGARAQALFELRLAVEHEPGLAEKTAPLATTLARTYDELLTAVPAGQPGAMVLNMMARELGKPAESDLRRQVDLEAVSRDPEMVEPRTRLLFGLFEEMESVVAGRGPGPSCPSADVCAAEIERHAAAIDKARPNAATGAMMRARGLIAQGRRAEAEALLVDGCTRLESRSDCLHLRAENLAELNDVPKLEAVLKELMSSNCMTAASCAAAATFVGHLRTKRNEPHAAASAYMRAAQEEATEERWLLAADASERAKMYAQAIEALSHLSTMRNGTDTAVNARISRLRAEAAAEQMRRF